MSKTNNKNNKINNKVNHNKDIKGGIQSKNKNRKPIGPSLLRIINEST